MVIDSMFVYRFVDSNLRVEMFHTNILKKFRANFKKISAFLLFFFGGKK